VRIRHVRAGEADRVRAIRLEALRADLSAFGATYEGDLARSSGWWERWARLSEAGEEQRTFVAVDDDDAWFWIALARPDDDAPGDAVLNAMWVAPAARRRGVGVALCEACAGWAFEHGFPALNLNVKVDNLAARATYRAAGFVFVREERDEFVLTRRL
jgi:ribosomal protein S18 acetylase RimI-like enzyme